MQHVIEDPGLEWLAFRKGAFGENTVKNRFRNHVNIKISAPFRILVQIVREFFSIYDSDISLGTA
jgi:hypothetical protein